MQMGALGMPEKEAYCLRMIMALFTGTRMEYNPVFTLLVGAQVTQGN